MNDRTCGRWTPKGPCILLQNHGFAHSAYPIREWDEYEDNLEDEPEEQIRAWGFEFEWRNSGSKPLQYRKVGGCKHDWIQVDFDHPLVTAVRSLEK